MSLCAQPNYDLSGKRRIVGVPLGPGHVEGGHVGRIELRVQAQTLHQVRVGEEWPAERDQVGAPLDQRTLGARAIETAGQNEQSRKAAAQFELYLCRPVWCGNRGIV